MSIYTPVISNKVKLGPVCPACDANRLHTKTEEAVYHPLAGHPLAGHGFTKEQGWSHPKARSLHDEEELLRNAKNI